VRTTPKALLAVLAFSLAALAAYHFAVPPAGPAETTTLRDGTSVAALDISPAFHQPSEELLDTAFRQVQEHYYKPVVAQQLLDGEQRELGSYFKTHNLPKPKFPDEQANGDRLHDEQLINRTLQIAEATPGVHSENAELTQIAIRGMMSALGDPYTTYLSPHEIAALEESLRGGDFGGIGVYIVQDAKTKQILVDPIEGMPADRAGIKPGDEVLAVDGIPTAGLSLDQVEHEIRGPKGTNVRLLLKRHGTNARRTVAVTRGQIVVPSVHAKMEDGFEYVRLLDFGQTSYDEVRRAMISGKEHNAKGYILDLRNNGGGLLEAAVLISSLFIPDGTIVTQIDREGNRETRTSVHDSLGVTPLVVLVNKYTASASEITAGAVQDYKVGTLIGTRTFGKGVVQSIYNMRDGGALKITTARYVTPVGRDIHHKGIQPDIVVNQAIEPAIIDSPKDEQLAAAKEYLRRTRGGTN
jgi:carboxyl-terminal processing protease